jgi:hypothetical protein
VLVSVAVVLAAAAPAHAITNGLLVGVSATGSMPP